MTATSAVVAPRVEVGPIAATGALGAGAFVGEWRGPGHAGALLTLGAATLGAAWFVRDRARLALAMVALAMLGTATMQRALDGAAHPPFAAAIEHGTFVSVSGTLRSDPSGPRFTADALVAVDRLDAAGATPATWPGAGRILRVRAGGDDAARLRALQAGDQVQLLGDLAPLGPGIGDDRARWRHAVGRLDHAEVRAFRSARSPLLAVANRLRERVLDGSRALAPEPRALLAGFLLGDTRAVPDAVIDDYRDAGLSHLLAVSGANVAFTLALVGPLVRRLRLGGRLGAGSAVVLVFAAMTRFEPSVLRASALAVCALVAAFAGRPVAPLRLLALAVCALVLIDPFLVHSVGFALSVAASAGIALWSTSVARRLPGPRFLRDAFAVSLAAELGVAPILLLTFGSIPVVAPLANLLAVPVAEPLGVYGMVASAATSLVPVAGPLLHVPTALMLGWITAVAHTMARVPLTLDVEGALACSAVVAAGLAASLGLRARRLGTARVDRA